VCPSDPANLSGDYGKVVCEKNTACCSGADAAACPANVGKAFDNTYPNLVTSAQQGKVSVDCDKYVACAKALESASCGDWPSANGYWGADPVPSAGACHAFIVPKLAAGDSCTEDYQCVGGFCWDTEGGDAGAPDHKCHAFVGDGQGCASILSSGAEDKLCDPATHFCNGSNVCQERKA